MIQKIVDKVISLEDFCDKKYQQDANRSKKTSSIPCFTLIPSFNFFQLFLIACENQYYGKRLLAQQTFEKYTEANASDANFNLRNFINNQSISNRKDLLKTLLLQLAFAENYKKANQKEVKKKGADKKEDKNKEEEDKIERENLCIKEDDFFDRKNILKSIESNRNEIAFSRNMEFIELDDSDQGDKIISKLQNSEITNCPVLFYGQKEGSLTLDIPVKVLVIQKYELKDHQLIKYAKKKKIYQGKEEKNIKKINEEFNEDMAQKNNQYYRLLFIIGAKLGVPILILFDDNKIIKIYDGKSELVPDYDDLNNSIDNIYLLFYSIDGLDGLTQLKNSSSLKSKIMHSQISETDNILKDFIAYKLEYSWSNHKFNFIELIKESVIYPAFFGFCSGFNLDISFCGSVVLGTDKNSESSIINNLELKKQHEVRQFIQTYGTFTAFVLSLRKFLGAIKEQNFENANTLVKYLFGTVVSSNPILFDLFVDFLLKIVNTKSLESCKKTIEQCLLSTISNKDKLGLKSTNSQSAVYNKLFNLSQRQGESATPIIAVKMLEEILNDQYFTKFFDNTVEIKLNDLKQFQYDPKYIKINTYDEYLEKAFILPEIQI